MNVDVAPLHTASYVSTFVPKSKLISTPAFEACTTADSTKSQYYILIFQLYHFLHLQFSSSTILIQLSPFSVSSHYKRTRLKRVYTGNIVSASP
jgi:hypothetical protein